MTGQDIAQVAIEMLTKHGYSVDEVFTLLRRSHSREEIVDIFDRAPILRDYSKEITPLKEDVEMSERLLQKREQLFAEQGQVSEQQEAANVGYRFSIKQAEKGSSRRALIEAMRVTKPEGK